MAHDVDCTVDAAFKFPAEAIEVLIKDVAVLFFESVHYLEQCQYSHLFLEASERKVYYWFLIHAGYTHS